MREKVGASKAASPEWPHSSFLQVWDGEMGHSRAPLRNQAWLWEIGRIGGILQHPEPGEEMGIQFLGGMTQRLLPGGLYRAKIFLKLWENHPGTRRLKIWTILDAVGP